MINKLKIVFLDIDGTIHKGDTLWEILHKKNKTWENKGKHYLKDFLDGKLSYEDFAKLDAIEWQGMSEEILLDSIKDFSLFPEVTILFNELLNRGCLVYLVSNGIGQLAEFLVNTHNLHGYAANPLVISEGILTGKISLDIPYKGKGKVVKQILEEHNIAPEHAMAVGDGPGDFEMLCEVGNPIYYNESRKPLPGYNGYITDNWKDILEYMGITQ